MAEEKKGMSKGCLTALIVFGILAVIVIALGIVCYVYQDELISWGLGKTTEVIGMEIKANLPEGVTEQEVDEVIEKFQTFIKEKKLTQEQLQRVATTFQDAYEDKKIDSDEAEKILNELKKIVGE